MPVKSQKQKRFMQAAANNPDFAKKAGIKPSVAKEFLTAEDGGVVEKCSDGCPCPKCARKAALIKLSGKE